MKARMLHVVALLVPLAAAGCQTTGAQTHTGGLAEGKRAFEQNQPAQAVDLLTRFLAQQRSGPDGAHAYYIRGMARAKLGERPGAYDDLRQALAAGPSDEVFWRANMVLGTMHFEDSAWDRAGDAFIAALSRMPNNPPRDLAFYRLGQCYERLGQWKAARQPFQQLVDFFPDSPLTPDARRRLDQKTDHFTVQVGTFSQPANAQRVVADLRALGQPAEAATQTRGGRTVYVVTTGRYRTYAEATAALGAVRNRYRDAVLWP